MDPLGDFTSSEGRNSSTAVEDEFSDLHDEEACNNVSVARSVQIFFNENSSESRSPSAPVFANVPVMESNPEQCLVDPLSEEINYANIQRNETNDNSTEGMEVDTEGKEVKSEGKELDSSVFDEVVIKQEPEWDGEEINIVDNHLEGLSSSPRKRIRELKILLRKETEENVGDRNEKRYSLRQSARVNRRVWSLKSVCKSDDTANGGDENIWSDDSDNDPDYAPQEEAQLESYKSKRKYVVTSVRKLCRRKKSEPKKSFCLYCNKHKYKFIVQHVLTAHSNKPEIKSIISLPTGSQEKKEAMAVLCKKIEENDVRATEEEKLNIKNVCDTRRKNCRVLKSSVCFYCKKRLKNLRRHLLTNHNNKSYVKYLLRLPKGSKERRLALKLILNKGNYAYNQEIIANGAGSIISSRTQQKQDNLDTFVSCDYCFGFFKKDCLSKHKNKCNLSGDVFEETLKLSETKDDSQKEIKVLTKKKNKRRKFKPPSANVKVSACFYCKLRVRSISRHLLMQHDEKPYIKHLLSLPKGSEERKNALKLIRNKGNFLYNKEIIAKGEGAVITTRLQKGQDHQPSNFHPCRYCLGFFKKKWLRCHEENCSKKSESIKVTPDDENEDFKDIAFDCSSMDIIQNLAKGNLVGEESDLDLKIKKTLSKRYYCYYCEKLLVKFVPHLQAFHKDKPEVQHVLSLKKGSKQRHQALQEIRRKGNFLYNKTLLNTTNGTLLTLRKSYISIKYFPCEFCFGFYSLNTLVKHVYKCESNTMSAKAKEEGLKYLSEFKRKREISMFSSTLLNCQASVSSSVDQILSNLKNTKIGTLAKNDKLIIQYGAYQLERGKISTKLITRKMCYLAKLVIQVNVFESNISNLFQSFSADNFKTFLKAALQICMTSQVKNASALEKSLRTSLRHCCMIAKNDSLMRKDDTALRQINDFYALFAEHWSELIVPLILENSKITEHNSEPGEKKESKKKVRSCTSVVDLVKQDLIQNLCDNQNLGSRFDNNSHCSSVFGTKKNVCLFCNKKYRNLRRHWFYSHHDEPEIIKLSQSKKYSSERNLLMSALRNKGNYLHNKYVLQQKKGCLVRKRGQALVNGFSDYLPCEYCLGFYKQNKRLRVHLKRCPLNPLLDQGKIINMKLRRLLQMPLLMNDLEKESSVLNEVVEEIKMEDFKDFVKKDNLIMKYGRLRLSQNSTRTSRKLMPYRLCDLAKILYHCQKHNDQIKTLTDCFQPEQFDHILDAMKTMSLSKPHKSLALTTFSKLRFSILTCVLILRNECLLKNNERELKAIHECEVKLNRSKLTAEDCDKYEEGTCFSPGRNNPAAVSGTLIPKGKVVKWTKEETDAISSHFSSHIKNGVVPGKPEIVAFFRRHENLKYRGWLRIKHKIHNMIVKIKRQSSHEKMVSDTIDGQRKCDNPETGLKVDKIQDEIWHPDKLVQTANEFQKTSPVHGETLTIHNPENGMQHEGISNEELHSSSAALMKDLDDFCDIGLPSVPQDTLENENDIVGENCPDNEERTYLLLGSSNHSQQAGYESTSVTPDVAFVNNSIEQLEPMGLDSSAPADSPPESSTQGFNLGNDLATVCQNGSRSILDTRQDPSNPSRCQTLIEGIREEGREQTCHGTPKNTHPISPSVECNRYKNKGINCKWKDDEMNAVKSYFSNHIISGKVPSKEECLDCKEENSCLKLRNWVSIKSKVYNIIRSNKNTRLKPTEESCPETTEENQSLDNVYSSDSDDSIVSNSEKREKYPKRTIKQTQDPTFAYEEDADSDNSMVSDSKKRKKSQKGTKKQTHDPTFSYEKKSDSDDSIVSNSKNRTKCPNSSKKQTWSYEENAAIASFFKEHINSFAVPGKTDCEQCISLNSCLASRSWVTVKSKVHNIITYNKRKRAN